MTTHYLSLIWDQPLTRKLGLHLDAYQGLQQELVFISDGAIWLPQLIQQHYPQATLILDFYHAMSYIGEALSELDSRQTNG